MNPSQFSVPVAECLGVDSKEVTAGGGLAAALGLKPVQIPRGRCTLNWLTLKDAIATAYGIESIKRDQNILGGPSWIGSDRYHIEGVALNPATVTSAQLRLMFQRLLADRFKLKLHKESRDLPGYALLVARNGPRLEIRNAGEDKSGLAGRPGSLRGNSIGLPGLATALSTNLGLPVVDETGLTGRYNFSLTWTPGQADMNGEFGGMPPEVRGQFAGDPNGPSIFTAVQEQLGLRLEARKIPTDVIVIDHAEKPDAN
jgi:uncharacterized protein (TIGR03435 family)